MQRFPAKTWSRPLVAATLALAVVATRLGAQPLVERSPYDALLAAYVNEQGVNYAGLSKERANLEAFVQSLAAVSSESLKRAPVAEQVAFWINAYNAIMLLTVVEKYPLPFDGARSIQGVWDEAKREVAGAKLSLNQIKHERLIGNLSEPRAHFALALASRGGPALRPRAYDQETVDSALDEAARVFVSDPGHIRVEPGKDAQTTGTVYLSQVFQWFGDDFVAKYAPPEQYAKRFGPKIGACLNFLALYLPSEIQKFVRQGEFKVEFIEYDWTLNDAPPPPPKPPAPEEAPAPPPGPEKTDDEAEK